MVVQVSELRCASQVVSLGAPATRGRARRRRRNTLARIADLETPARSTEHHVDYSPASRTSSEAEPAMSCRSLASLPSPRTEAGANVLAPTSHESQVAFVPKKSRKRVKKGRQDRHDAADREQHEPREQQELREESESPPCVCLSPTGAVARSDSRVAKLVFPIANIASSQSSASASTISSKRSKRSKQTSATASAASASPASQTEAASQPCSCCTSSASPSTSVKEVHSDGVAALCSPPVAITFATLATPAPAPTSFTPAELDRASVPPVAMIPSRDAHLVEQKSGPVACPADELTPVHESKEVKCLTAMTRRSGSSSTSTSRDSSRSRGQTSFTTSDNSDGDSCGGLHVSADTLHGVHNLTSSNLSKSQRTRRHSTAVPALLPAECSHTAQSTGPSSPFELSEGAQWTADHLTVVAEGSLSAPAPFPSEEQAGSESAVLATPPQAHAPRPASCEPWTSLAPSGVHDATNTVGAATVSWLSASSPSSSSSSSSSSPSSSSSASSSSSHAALTSSALVGDLAAATPLALECGPCSSSVCRADAGCRCASTGGNALIPRHRVASGPQAPASATVESDVDGEVQQDMAATGWQLASNPGARSHAIGHHVDSPASPALQAFDSEESHGDSPVVLSHVPSRHSRHRTTVPAVLPSIISVRFDEREAETFEPLEILSRDILAHDFEALALEPISHSRSGPQFAPTSTLPSEERIVAGGGQRSMPRERTRSRTRSRHDSHGQRATNDEPPVPSMPRVARRSRRLMGDVAFAARGEEERQARSASTAASNLARHVPSNAVHAHRRPLPPVSLRPGVFPIDPEYHLEVLRRCGEEYFVGHVGLAPLDTRCFTLCRYQELGECKRGGTCAYAHSFDEVRQALTWAQRYFLERRVHQFLVVHRLDSWIPIFAGSEIDWASLCELSAEDLQTLGFTCIDAQVVVDLVAAETVCQDMAAVALS